MQYLVNLWNKEPALVVGTVATIIVIVAQQLLASGIVTSAGAVNWLNFVIGLVPAIAAVFTRSQVSPA